MLVFYGKNTCLFIVHLVEVLAKWFQGVFVHIVFNIFSTVFVDKG